MIIGWNVATYSPGLLGPIDEVRISYLNRLYTYPTTGPLVKDVYTQCLYEFDITPPVNTGQAPVYTVTVPNPVQGADWSYTLPAPARLKLVSAVLYAGNLAASRLPLLNIVMGGRNNLFPVATVLTINQLGYIDWAPGLALAEVAGGGYFYLTAPIPDLLLPAGSVVSTYTEAITTADQWQQLVLTFSAE
jgi:hypothetical protein